MESFKRTKVEALMSSPVETVKADWSLQEAARHLLRRGITGAPVVDEDERVVGVLSLQDIARHAKWHLDAEEGASDPSAERDMLRELDAEEEGLRSSMHIDRLEGATVRQVMTPNVSTVKNHTPLAEVTAVLLRDAIHRIFVRNSRGKLVGVVSTMDVVRALHERLARENVPNHA